MSDFILEDREYPYWEGKRIEQEDDDATDYETHYRDASKLEMVTERLRVVLGAYMRLTGDEEQMTELYEVIRKEDVNDMLGAVEKVRRMLVALKDDYPCRDDSEGIETAQKWLGVYEAFFDDSYGPTLSVVGWEGVDSAEEVPECVCFCLEHKRPLKNTLPPGALI